MYKVTYFNVLSNNCLVFKNMFYNMFSVVKYSKS